MKAKLTHYEVHALKDGCVLLAVPTRKPSSRTRGGEAVRIDEDGIHQTHVIALDTFTQGIPEVSRMAHAAIAGRLNTRRAIRDLVHPRLDQLEQRLERIEAKLDRLLGERDS